jgi:phosphoribosylformylglycinamidine cyclo-ligase
MPITYRQAGVDIDAGDDLVERIKPFAKATRIAEVIGDVGGFAGLCSVPRDIEDPVLVSGTDGVGTKLKVAFATGKHDTIGQDLVGMCVNDVITCGARPLFFLDYFATGKLDVDVAEQVIKGIAAACKESGCALLGGETAELPGMYAEGEYDLAGFAVGVVAKKKIIDGKRVVAGDVAIALPSSGLHSNGFSLARRVLKELTDPALLTPTRLYAKDVMKVIDKVDVRAMSHITGGGLPGNLPRVLPDGLGVKIEKTPARPEIFERIQKLGPVEEAEMRRTFNCGIGFVFIVKKEDAEATVSLLGDEAVIMGSVVEVSADTPFEERVIW